MEFRIDSLHVQIESGDKAIEDSLRSIMMGWPTLLLDPLPNEHGMENQLLRSKTADIRIIFKSVDRLSSLPETKPYFVEKIAGIAGETGTIALFKTEKDFRLFFRGRATIHFSLPKRLPSAGSVLEIEVLESIVGASQLEDILFSGLAPLLRRLGYYMVHSFAASRDNMALLLIGKSGSGKTTAGLSLIQQGWGYLANDMIILKNKGESIWALPTPGGISLTPMTAEILSPFISGGSLMPESKPNRKEYYPAVSLISSWSEAVPVGAICFPMISVGGKGTVGKIEKATALAQIMEASIDRWDDAMLIEHINFLGRLCDQTQCLALQLGDEVGELSRILSTTWD